MDSNKQPRLEAEETGASIVDVRPLSAFLLRHLRGSVSFELATLGLGSGGSTRATELPARSWPNQLVVMGTDEEEKNLGLDWLETRGWKVNREGSLTEATAPWDAANTQTGQGSFLCRFWKASPVLEQKAEWMLREPSALPKVAIDLGCGSGRDAIFLAKTGWDVLAVDREDDFLNKLASFATRQGVHERIACHNVDMRPQFLQSQLAPLLAQNPYSLIHLSRFMNRPLLQFLAQTVPVGSYIAIHHFLVGATSRNGKPFRQGSDQTLERGELSGTLFPSPEFETVWEQESSLVDGRPVINFITQKKVASTLL